MVWSGISLMSALAFFLLPSSASAAPTPPLTGVSIVGITPDGNGYKGSNSNLSGTECVIAVYCQGTIWAPPNYPVISQGGELVPTTEDRPNEYVTDSGGYVIGTVHYRAFDLSDVTTGILSASAQDYNTPHRTFTDFISIIVS
ncbi:hypothetical protein [Paenibacillus macerans]|uniref:DUF4879 domain-containing protein n=1 Tax=Paenibacillus macerans TaxID=44252 RepID=A0A090ZCJ8_PAEMA|nr:hypothetical protein [Paenibacillus macerans]KFN08377.1 hypothetical protein DJ90_1512 [Paenibacillus macerans]MCY7559503.1 hypothetical protein [Paenibacillus macerans]MEC0152498.1 hypothetical protein [Paenibacillus macerans]SUA83537.1 Uncharacterised protein [Paenibacillus macerans]